MLKSLIVLCILAACWLRSEAGYNCHCGCSCSCPKQGAQAVKWIRVTAAMVKRTVSFGVRLTRRNIAGGLVISGHVTSNGCGKAPGGSGAVVFIKGDWKQIIYTQEFMGSASCWKIFGNSLGNFGWGSKPSVDNGLEPFSLARGDAIMSQLRMNSRSADRFDGRTRRCDNLRVNFWHGLNGAGKRQATVVLRRKKGARDAGIATETSCGRPRYVIKDIYVSK